MLTARTPRSFAFPLATWVLILVGPAFAQGPEVQVTKDDTVISRSCIVRIPEGLVIPDARGDGVIQIKGDHIVVAFAPGSVLRGAPATRPADALLGTGIALIGRKDVEIRGAAIEGYRVGIQAMASAGLGIGGGSISALHRRRLSGGTTPPKPEIRGENDQNEWLKARGAAVWIEDSDELIVRGLRVRDAADGIVFDHVRKGLVIDCDASFLAGFGLSLWRSSECTVYRNALDGCADGIETPGETPGATSGGVLLARACHRNLIVENSGVAGTTGLMILGTPPAKASQDSAICSENWIVGNDFSGSRSLGAVLRIGTGNVLAKNLFHKNAAGATVLDRQDQVTVAHCQLEGRGTEPDGIAIRALAPEAGRIFNNQSRHFRVGMQGEAGPADRASPQGAPLVVADNEWHEGQTALALRGPVKVGWSGNLVRGYAQEIDHDADAAAGLSKQGIDSLKLSMKKITQEAKTEPVQARPALRSPGVLAIGPFGPVEPK